MIVLRFKIRPKKRIHLLFKRCILHTKNTNYDKRFITLFLFSSKVVRNNSNSAILVLILTINLIDNTKKSPKKGDHF